MKHTFLLFALLAGMQFSFAGNGDGLKSSSGVNPSCNCTIPTEVNFYASGTAVIIGNRVECEGQGGLCWEVHFKSDGAWILTIYTQPPVTFSSNRDQDDPPGTLNVSSKGDGYVIYEIGDEWKRQ